MKKYVFRILGGCLGFAFLVVGLINALSLSFDQLDWLTIITFAILGVYLLNYSVTGRSTFYKRKEKKGDASQ